VKVALTGHGTTAPLVPSLVAEFARHRLLAEITSTSFDSYVFELTDPASVVYRSEAALVLCVLDPGVILDEVPVPWRASDVAEAADRKLALIERLADRFGEAGHGTLVLNTLPLPRHAVAQLLDYRSRAELGAVWREANARLLRLSASRPAVVVIDTDPLLAEAGVAARDSRLDTYARVRLDPSLLAGYAREVGHLGRHIVGRTSKCLVLDLDGTVWGGIVGDDGPDGIQVAESPAGEAFRVFQRTALQLQSQGVLLAAVSKNDPEPVLEVFRHHPRMTLREEHFVRIVANWRPKHQNLTELAEALNLAPDSFVFVDDSPYERELLRRELPGVTVIGVDSEPALHADRLLRDGWFDTRELTSEDLARAGRYREELARRDFAGGFESIEDYLRELEVTVRLAPAAEADVPRVSQLTLRTNQFNLTTRRLQPAEVTALMADPASQVLTIRSSDRFGDYGLVGVIFSREDGDGVHMDNFVLSCRVFSRGIEQACLSSVLRRAREAGAAYVRGRYQATARNGIVRDLYPRHGFTALPAADGEVAVFRHELADIPPVPGHLRLLEDYE
jgi:FkbH-like protein